MIDVSSQNAIMINSDKTLELVSQETLRISSKEMNVNHKTKTEIGDKITSKGSTNSLEFSTISIKGNIKSS